MSTTWRRGHYGDETITQWDIFYYVYGFLHDPGHREKIADSVNGPPGARTGLETAVAIYSRTFWVSWQGL
jgi:hypothetical protein